MREGLQRVGMSLSEGMTITVKRCLRVLGCVIVPSSMISRAFECLHRM